LGNQKNFENLVAQNEGFGKRCRGFEIGIVGSKMTIAILIWIAVIDTAAIAFAIYGYFAAKSWGK
jgi:hypothetical protein